MSWDQLVGQMDDAIMQHVRDGTCTYQGTLATGTEVPYLLERDIEVFDEQGPAGLATTIQLQVSAIGGGRSRQGDSIVTSDRAWKVQRVLKDDGHWRVLEVT